MKGILLDSNGDLLIVNGQFGFGDPTQQNQKCLLLAEKGEYRQYPDVGVGINSQLDNEELANLETLIQTEFEKDGMTVASLKIYSNGTINVQASYQ